MLRTKEHIVLVDLPTFPKGVLSLSFSAIEASLPEGIEVRVVDLNLEGLDLDKVVSIIGNGCLFVGLKVSSQNFQLAKALSVSLKEHFNNQVVIVWGGEFPTLLPNESLEYADAVVCGSFEPIAEKLVTDIRENQIAQIYQSDTAYDLSKANPSRIDVVPQLSSYYRFMGVPLETSRGCDKKCTFCMVHVMQPTYQLKPIHVLEVELANYAGRFVNVVDYNIGVSKEHILNVAQAFKRSQVLGWMGEMCLQSLDDEEVLVALSQSRCRMIYAGLEGVDELALRSVNKGKTNNLHDYQRIINAAQKHGIQISAGVILGLEGTTDSTFSNILRSFNNWGIAYAKLTFLTYNLGTKVRGSMEKKGEYLSNEHGKQDGNHLTFLPHGVNSEVVYDGASKFIEAFFSLRTIIKRTRKSGLHGTRQLEFVLFILCYSKVYRDWLKHGLLKKDADISELLLKPFTKSVRFEMAEKLLHVMRLINYKLDTLKF